MTVSIEHQGDLADGYENWNDTELVSLSLEPALDAALPLLVEGDSFTGVPEFSVSLTADYIRQLRGNLIGVASLAFNHIDEMPGALGTGSFGDSRDLLSLRVGCEGNRWGAFLVARNLLDEDSVVFRQEGGGYIPVVSLDYPRQIGVELTFQL